MKNIIVLNSITHAQMGKDILYKYDVKGYVERLPSNLRDNGCGYGLKVSADDLSYALRRLADENLKVKRVISIE